jgi:DNA polymerase-1
VPDVTSHNGQVRQAAERVAVNMPIQGTAADILKRAMINVHAALQARPARHDGRRARMILTVHDELLFEVPRDEADEVAALDARLDMLLAHPVFPQPPEDRRSFPYPPL